MATLIVEVDDSKLKMVKDVLKALGIRVNQTTKSEKIPNQATVEAIKDARNGKVTRIKNVDKFFKSI